MPESIPITQLHHIARTTRDAEKSLIFYRDVLGFRPIQRPNFSFKGAWLSGYGLQIHIIQGFEGPESDSINPTANHIALAVDDFEPVEKSLKEFDIPYHKQVNAGGIPQIFFHDPDGHHVEIGIYPADPPYLDEN